MQFQSHTHNVMFCGDRLLHDFKRKIKRHFQIQKCSNSLFHCFDCGKVTFQVNFVFNARTLAHSMRTVILMIPKFVLESFYSATSKFISVVSIAMKVILPLFFENCHISEHQVFSLQWDNAQCALCVVGRSTLRPFLSYLSLFSDF